MHHHVDSTVNDSPALALFVDVLNPHDDCCMFWLSKLNWLVCVFAICRGLAEAVMKGDQAFKINLWLMEEHSPTLMLPKPLHSINDTYHVVASGYLVW